MRPKTSFLIASGLFFAATLGLAWYTWREHSRLEESLRTLHREQIVLSGKIRDAQDQVDAQKKNETETQARIKALQAANGQAATPP